MSKYHAHGGSTKGIYQFLPAQRKAGRHERETFREIHSQEQLREFLTLALGQDPELSTGTQASVLTSYLHCASTAETTNGTNYLKKGATLTHCCIFAIPLVGNEAKSTAFNAALRLLTGAYNLAGLPREIRGR